MNEPSGTPRERVTRALDQCPEVAGDLLDILKLWSGYPLAPRETTLYALLSTGEGAREC